MSTNMEVLPDSGLNIPDFKIESVDFEVMPHEIVVSTFGDLPLYRAHRFEDAIKKVLIQNTESIKQDFKKTMQKAEDFMW